MIFSRTEEQRRLDSAIFSVAGPAMGGFMSMILFDIADIFWIAKMGPEAVAGVASATFIIWTIYAVMQTTGSGCGSLVSQAFGAEDRKAAFRVIVEGTWMSVFMSLVLTALLWTFLETPFSWMGLSPSTTEFALRYFTVMVLGIPVIFLYFQSGAIFNAYGDTKASNLIMGASLGINIILDPILMFGWFGLPVFGIQGAAYATIFSLPTLFITVPLTLGRVPLGWFLGHYFQLGATGIWWAISISTCGKGIGLAILFWFLKKEFHKTHPHPVEPTK